MDSTNFEAKRAKALELLKTTGIRRSNYEPPLVSLLWKMGYPVPPPHFASFFASSVLSGVFFGVTWGLFMWFFVWSNDGLSTHAAMLTSTVSGSLFGIAMATYYAYGRRKYRLPSWDSL